MSELIVETTSFLPHEAAASALTDEFDPEVTGFGTVVGGSAPAVLIEAKAFANTGHAATLDSPHPINGMVQSDYPHTNFDILGYDTPIGLDGNPLTQAAMIDAYLTDDQWMTRHVAQRMKPGKSIVIAHHTVGTSLEPHIQAHVDQENTLMIARYHSRLLAVDRANNPNYYDQAYPGTYGRELWQLQADSLTAMDFILFPTVSECEDSIQAMSQYRILEKQDAIAKSIVSPIPLDLSEFKPDPTGKKRTAAIATINDTLKPENKTNMNHIPLGVSLTNDSRILGYVGRFDFEKGIWELIDEYVDFLTDHSAERNLPFLVAIGGLTNKPGIVERHMQTLEKIKNLPGVLQRQIIMPLIPLAHQDAVHAYDLQIYNSNAEAFNIGEKQARSAGIPVGLSTVPAHIDTNTPHSALFFPPNETDDLHRLFSQVMKGDTFDNYRRNGRDHARTFGDEGVCHDLIRNLADYKPDFFQPDQYSNIHPSVQVHA